MVLKVKDLNLLHETSFLLLTWLVDYLDMVYVSLPCSANHGVEVYNCFLTLYIWSETLHKMHSMLLNKLPHSKCNAGTYYSIIT